MVHIMGYIPVYRDRVVAKGHKAIRALHPTTFELTKDGHLTERGDCIIGVELDRGACELDPKLKEMLKKSTSVVLIVLRVGDVADTVVAQGNSALTFNDCRKIIVRRSSYIDPATIAVNANKASRNIRRDLVKKLRDPEAVVVVDIYVLDLGDVLLQGLKI